MATSPRYIENILSTETLGDSLIKLNNNFQNLQDAINDLSTQINNMVQVRTFFYYGPSSGTDPNSGMENGKTTRPSNSTILNFVNSTSQLNVPAISKINDVVYVVYQKTGYVANQAIRVTSGSIPVKVISFSTTVSWSTTTPDILNTFSPVFFIWRLTYNGSQYTVDSSFPKFFQSTTLSTNDWSNPRNWTSV